MREPNRVERAKQRANFRQRTQEFSAQGCPRCRGSKVQVIEPPPLAYDPRYELSCLDCGEMWWAE
jgi:hypothetical protein